MHAKDGRNHHAPILSFGFFVGRGLRNGKKVRPLSRATFAGAGPIMRLKLRPSVIAGTAESGLGRTAARPVPEAVAQRPLEKRKPVGCPFAQLF